MSTAIAAQGKKHDITETGFSKEYLSRHTDTGVHVWTFETRTRTLKQKVLGMTGDKSALSFSLRI